MKHGQRAGKRSKEYMAWDHMKQRCLNPNNKRYNDYGGRGIKVCERWLLFENFLADVGLAPSNLHSLDRFPDNDGHYEPANVRWATIEEQNINKRTVKIINGKTATQISIELGGDKMLVARRIKRGWDVDKAISTPKMP